MSRNASGGVPDVAHFTELLEKLVGRDEPSGGGYAASTYQRLFARLLKVHGRGVAQKLLRKQVLRAYDITRVAEPGEKARPSLKERLSGDGGWNEPSIEDELKSLEHDELGWYVPVGTRALGRIVAEFPVRYHDLILTTNFDPLIPIALRLAHCPATQTILGSDGNPAQTLVQGCHVIHLHGYWYGQDGLHTAQQLKQERPILNAYLKDIMRRHTLVVVGYSGWDDLFTSAIQELSQEQDRSPDILWTFFKGEQEEQENHARIQSRVKEAHGQGHVNFYYDIDCHQLFPRLLHSLRRGTSTRAFPASAPLSGPPPYLKPADGQRRMRAAIYQIRWSWGSGGSGGRAVSKVLLGRGALAEWFRTKRSIVIERLDSAADSLPEREPDQLWFLGPTSGGRFLAALWDVPLPEAAENEVARTLGIEIPSQIDNEDTLFTCDVIYPNATSGIAANLTRKNPTEHWGENVCEGIWLKISAAGGVFVVKLHTSTDDEGQQLTERSYYGPRRLWRGHWKVEEGRLAIEFPSWVLETAALEDLPPSHIEPEAWGMFAGTETNSGGAAHAGDAESATPFLVLHVPPPRQG